MSAPSTVDMPRLSSPAGPSRRTYDRRSLTTHDRRAQPAGRNVEQYAASLLAADRPATVVLSELAQRIDAHGDAGGYCRNGCNRLGWQEPFPCPTRLFYLAVREHLSLLRCERTGA